jgi:hypothetical protein
MRLDELIAEAIRLKQGNKEFALFYCDYDEHSAYSQWQAHIGNPTTCVGLGEVSGEFVGEGETPEDAMAKLNIQLLIARI